MKKFTYIIALFLSCILITQLSAEEITKDSTKNNTVINFIKQPPNYRFIINEEKWLLDDLYAYSAKKSHTKQINTYSKRGRETSWEVSYTDVPAQFARATHKELNGMAFYSCKDFFDSPSYFLSAAGNLLGVNLALGRGEHMFAKDPDTPIDTGRSYGFRYNGSFDHPVLGKGFWDLKELFDDNLTVLMLSVGFDQSQFQDLVDQTEANLIPINGYHPWWDNDEPFYDPIKG